jgi:hypothetical protein
MYNYTNVQVSQLILWICQKETEAVAKTVAEAVVEAGGRGEAWAEAWATTSPN